MDGEPSPLLNCTISFFQVFLLDQTCFVQISDRHRPLHEVVGGFAADIMKLSYEITV